LLVRQPFAILFFNYDPNYDDSILQMLENEFASDEAGIGFSKESMEIAL